MSNTSATGGYLIPGGTSAPAEDQELEDILQDLVEGITGLAGCYVRPRWQPEPPIQPEPSVTWCAIGVTHIKPDAEPALIHDGTGNGADRLERHEDLTVLMSMYGPQAQAYATRMRDGIYIPQNREEIRKQNMSFVTVGEIISVPELVNQQWIRRYDLSIRMRRQIVRTYPVLNILSAEVTIVD